MAEVLTHISVHVADESHFQCADVHGPCHIQLIHIFPQGVLMKKGEFHEGKCWTIIHGVTLDRINVPRKTQEKIS